MSKSEMKVMINELGSITNLQTEKIEELGGITETIYFSLEARIVALERGLEGVLRRIEESQGPDDEAGWYGRPE